MNPDYNSIAELKALGKYDLKKLAPVANARLQAVRAGRFKAILENCRQQETLPTDFVKFVRALVCKHGVSPAYRSLFYDYLIRGKVIPGYGTDWCGIYSIEHDGWPTPQHCPYIPNVNTPKGWSERNLRRYIATERKTTESQLPHRTNRSQRKRTGS